jgi:hypothetical protein
MRWRGKEYRRQQRHAEGGLRGQRLSGAVVTGAQSQYVRMLID